jgi:hypothetical protein
MTADIPDAKALAEDLVAVDHELREVDVVGQVVELLNTNVAVLEKSLVQFRKRLDIRREKILAHQSK